jgi:GrpB-like predicted nucleotidyltransferase (UPF0157 family)
VVGIEHVGSTSVPGLAAKPILDIDIIAERASLSDAIRAMQTAGYEHLRDLRNPDRQAFKAPGIDLCRNVYACVAGALSLRNHLAVRDVLRGSLKLRSRYATGKLERANVLGMTIPRSVAGKSAVLQRHPRSSDLTVEEKRAIGEVNTGPV